MPGMPKTMFGKKQDDRDISGPTLSATNETVVDIRIVGNSTIPTSQILNQLQTRVNRPFDPALCKRDVRKLAARGWFVDVQPSYEQSPTAVSSFSKSSSGPSSATSRTSAPRFAIRSSKRKPISKKAVRSIPMPCRRPAAGLSTSTIAMATTTRRSRSWKATSQPTTALRSSSMKERRKKIWKVEFVGNEFIKTNRLKTKIESKPPLLMLFKGYVDREQIEADVNKLTAFYRSYGYFDAKIGREYDFDEKNKWLTLRFVIHEGLRYEVENVAFIGNKIFSSDSLNMGVDLKPDSNSGPPLEKMWHRISPLPPGPPRSNKQK